MLLVGKNYIVTLHASYPLSLLSCHLTYEIIPLYATLLMKLSLYHVTLLMKLSLYLPPYFEIIPFSRHLTYKIIPLFATLLMKLSLSLPPYLWKSLSVTLLIKLYLYLPPRPLISPTLEVAAYFRGRPIPRLIGSCLHPTWWVGGSQLPASRTPYTSLPCQQ